MRNLHRIIDIDLTLTEEEMGVLRAHANEWQGCHVFIKKNEIYVSNESDGLLIWEYCMLYNGPKSYPHDLCSAVAFAPFRTRFKSITKL